MGMFRENLGLKLFSLLIAVLLEIYFYSPDNSVTTFLTANVEVRGLPPTMMIVSPDIGDKGLFTKLRIKGPGPLVKQIESVDHKISITLPTPTPTSYQAVFSANQLRLPPGIAVLDMDPPSVDLQLERVVRKELLVVADKVGEPPAGYLIENLQVYPETVFAKGPVGELDGLSIIETQKIDVSSIKESSQFEIPLADPGPLTTLGINVVRVEVKVSPILSEKTFNKVPIEVICRDSLAASADPGSVQIVLSGPERVMAKFSIGDVRLIADAMKLSEGRYELSLEAKLPAEVKVVKTVPERVVVNLVGKNG